MSRNTLRAICACLTAVSCAHSTAVGQSADWQEVVYREPQVRYLLADMTLGGSVELYRTYAAREKDPDSREAIRLWAAGARVLNREQFERKWVPNIYGEDGKVMRVVFRGTNRTITGNEVILTSDLQYNQSRVRLVLVDLSLGRPASFYAAGTDDPNVAEGLRRWNAGVRAVNTGLFAVQDSDTGRRIVYRDTTISIDGTHVRLNSDVPYPETNVRYFMADIALGGSIDFYRRAAERDHEMGCLEAVLRTEQGYVITNLDRFERKRIDGKVVITCKGSNKRISGMEVALSSD